MRFEMQRSSSRWSCKLSVGGEFGEFAELTDEITNSVRRSPQQAKELLDKAVAKLIPDANILTAQRSNPVIRET